MARTAAGDLPVACPVRELRLRSLVMISIMFVQRWIGIGLDFFSVTPGARGNVGQTDQYPR